MSEWKCKIPKVKQTKKSNKGIAIRLTIGVQIKFNDSFEVMRKKYLLLWGLCLAFKSGSKQKAFSGKQD